jgi:hypothetical protein
VIAICTLAVLSALVAWAKAAERPPSPVSASAPQTEFSAERAWVVLERIAGEQPTPIGSAGGDKIRDYLVEELIPFRYVDGIIGICQRYTTHR